MDSGDLLGIVTFVTVGFAATLFIGSRSRAMAPVVVAYVAHVLIGWVVLDLIGLYSTDAQLYDYVARGYVEYWNGLTAVGPDFATGKEGWVLILATIYRALGVNPLFGILFNALASAFTTSLIMGAAARLGWAAKAKAAGWLMLLPAFVFWSSLLLREALAWMLAALALWAAAGLVRRSNLPDAVWLIAAVAGSLWVRGSLAVVLLAGVVAGVAASRRRIPAPLVITGAAVAMLGGPLASRFTSIAGGADLEQVNAARTSLSTAGSGFATTAYSSPTDILLALPSTFPRALIGPYPQELVHLPLTAWADWTVWVLLLYLAWRGFRWAPGRGRWMAVVPALAILVVIAATSGNYGTMVRLRATPAVLLVPLAATGLQRRPKKEPPAKPVKHAQSFVRTGADRRLFTP